MARHPSRSADWLTHHQLVNHRRVSEWMDESLWLKNDQALFYWDGLLFYSTWFGRQKVETMQLRVVAVVERKFVAHLWKLESYIPVLHGNFVSSPTFEMVANICAVKSLNYWLVGEITFWLLFLLHFGMKTRFRKARVACSLRSLFPYNDWKVEEKKKSFDRDIHHSAKFTCTERWHHTSGKEQKRNRGKKAGRKDPLQIFTIIFCSTIRQLSLNVQKIRGKTLPKKIRNKNKSVRWNNRKNYRRNSKPEFVWEKKKDIEDFLLLFVWLVAIGAVVLPGATPDGVMGPLVKSSATFSAIPLLFSLPATYHYHTYEVSGPACLSSSLSWRNVSPSVLNRSDWQRSSLEMKESSRPIGVIRPDELISLLHSSATWFDLFPSFSFQLAYTPT